MKRAAAIVVACMLVFFIAQKYFHVSKPLAPQTALLPPKPQPVVTSLPPLTTLTLRRQTPPPNVAPAREEPPIETNQLTSSPLQSRQRAGKPPRQDPMARLALSMVGMDTAAEEYWSMAINDPSLSESEREDLIEDLNEEGFEDPKNPRVEELPLIVNRLQIIEEYAPFAMDDVNARSFAEAYKDLVNMYVRLTAQQPP